CDRFVMSDQLAIPLDLSAYPRVFLKAIIDYAQLQFYYAVEEGAWKAVGPELDMRILSDDYVREGSERYRPAFTGCFVGICCQDLSGRKCVADFDWFDYREKHD
ncbi:MAG: glycoside hydrolase 43 family protein, partial [Bacteroidota bacterium]